MNESNLSLHSAEAHLTIELTNVCNLHCSYCVRDEEALHQHAHFLPLDLIQRILNEARGSFALRYVSFTGGEPTLHPHFAEILALLSETSIACSFVTNGSRFERIYPALLAHRQTVRVIAFSLDGATAEAHDHWRGKGSFAQVMSAVTRCFMQGLPFAIKTVIRRDTAPQLEQITLLAARLGAANVQFSHLLPTSADVQDEMALSLAERTEAEREIALLNYIFKLSVGFTVGWHNTDPAPPCPSLAGQSANIDYRGRLTLCCNLSGFRGATAHPDIAADLTEESFAAAYQRLQLTIKAQNERRQQMLQVLAAQNQQADLYQGSPCLFCLRSFALIPWQHQPTATRALPVLPFATSNLPLAPSLTKGA